MHEAYLLTGGNVGDRIVFLEKAKEKIRNQCGMVLRSSSVYETAAWGKQDQPNFLNQVLLIQTSSSAQDLLEMLLDIEESIGRTRSEKYGPRTIDIDILFYDDRIINEPGLKIPHPQIPNRRFVLIPLAEIAADKIHPVFKESVGQLLEKCEDPLQVNKYY